MEVLIFLAVIGLMVILGVLTRNTQNDKDRDHIFLTMLRGLGTLMMLGTAISFLCAIIYVIAQIFS